MSSSTELKIKYYPCVCMFSLYAVRSEVHANENAVSFCLFFNYNFFKKAEVLILMYFGRTPFYHGIRGLGRLHDTNRAIVLIGCHSLRAESEWKLEQGEIQCQLAVPYHRWKQK